MEEWQRKYIQKHITKLIRDTSCNVQLIAELQTSGMIDYVDVDKLSALKGSDGPTSQAHYLYRILQQRHNGYENMTTALRNSHQTGAMKILLDGYHTNGQLNPFLEINYDAILSAEVNFQGVTSKLSQLFPQLTTDDLKEILFKSQARIDYSKIFEQKSKEFVLAVDTIPAQPEHYIPRSISNRLKLNSAIFKVACEDVFVFKGLDRVKLTQLAHPMLTSGSDKQLLEVTSRFISLEHEEDWQEIRNICKKPVHLIKYEAREYIVEDSSGGSSVLRKFLKKSSEVRDVCVSESEFLHDLERNKTKRGVCICDTPGMGKTMLLLSLARSIKQRHPERIVVFIRLSEFIQKLTTDIKETLPEFDSSLKLILEQITDVSLSAAILYMLIKRHGAQLDLFFDGLDEVSPEDLSWSTQFIQSLVTRTENTTAYVTSRPHVRNELETTIGVMAFDILPFTQTNQADFLIKFWRQKIAPPFCVDKLTEFAKLCLKNVHKNLSEGERDIMGIPLQCFLLAEIYTKEAKLYACLNRQYNFSLHKSTALYQMYKNFIDFRLSSCDSLSRHRAKALHVLMALKQLFPKIAKKYSKHIQAPIQRNLLSYGIIEQRESINSSRVVFIHRTIAEFLVAEFFGYHMFAEDPPFLSLKCFSSKIWRIQTIIEEFARVILADVEHIPNHQLPVMNIGHSVILRFINAYVSTQQLGFINEPFARRLAHSLRPSEFHDTLWCSIQQNQLYLLRFLLRTVRVAKASYMRKYWKSIFKDENYPHINYNSKLFCFFNDAVCNSNVELLTEIFRFYEEFVGLSDFRFTFQPDTPFHMALQLQKNYEVIECLVKKFGTNHPDLLSAFLFNLAVYSKSKMEIDENEGRIFQLLQHNSNESNQFQKDLNFPWNYLNPSNSPLSVIKFLAQEGADLYAINDDEESIAHVTAKYLFPKDYHDLCHYLKDINPVSDNNMHFLSAKNKFGQNALHTRLASDCVNTDLSTVMTLLNLPNVSANDIDVNGENLFLAAVRGGEQQDILEFLACNGADVNVSNINDENALHLALIKTPKMNLSQAVKNLIGLGVDTEKRNFKGQTPLDLAKSIAKYEEQHDYFQYELHEALYEDIFSHFNSVSS